MSAQALSARLTAGFSSETRRPADSGTTLTVLKGKAVSREMCLAKLSFKNGGGIKTFLNEQKLREFFNSSPAPQDSLKVVLQVKVKDQ